MKNYIVLWTENGLKDYAVFLHDDAFIKAEKFYNKVIEKQKTDENIHSINFMEIIQLDRE